MEIVVSKTQIVILSEAKNPVIWLSEILHFVQDDEDETHFTHYEFNIKC